MNLWRQRIVMYSEYHSYDAVYLTDDRITKQSTGQALNVLIMSTGRRIVMRSEYYSSGVVYFTDDRITRLCTYMYIQKCSYTELLFFI